MGSKYRKCTVPGCNKICVIGKDKCSNHLKEENKEKKKREQRIKEALK